MRAWLLDKTGSVADLRLADAARPSPGPGEVLLRMRFAGLNPADRYLAEGLYPAKPAFPHILGRDGLGEAVALGPGVEGLAAGELRLVLRGEAGVTRWGTFAEFAVVPAESLAALPAGWKPEQAGSAALTYLTAYQALTMWGPVLPCVVLVTGASGGVGSAAVHLARAMGHTVLGLSRDPAKAERLQGEGCHEVFSAEDRRWGAAVKAFLKGVRVGLAIDSIGGESFGQVIDVLGEGGKVSCVGRLAGPVPSFNTATLFFRRVRLGGVHVGAFAPAEAQAAWAEAVRLLSRTGRSPLVDSVWDFEDLGQAFSRLAAGPMGKVVLKI
ncbi:MAG: zinc-binding alcohol dehydrogenase family protein [Elusimicrobia bacterium]|nr:zinc-binding alcohol dehydrogenase family protein [Elusimicrobiota bacterium]